MSEYDITGDGFLDTSSLDVSGDGIVDAYATDLNQDGVTDVFSFDQDQNGVAEVTAFDADNNGVVDAVAIDADQDGVVDQHVYPGSTPVANTGVGADGTLHLASPWADSPLPDLSNPQVVDAITGSYGDDIMADVNSGPAHSGATTGVDMATGYGNLDAAEANMAGTVPPGTTQEYDFSSGGMTYYEPGDLTPDPMTDGTVDGY